MSKTEQLAPKQSTWINSTTVMNPLNQLNLQLSSVLQIIQLSRPQISQAKDDLILFSSSPTEATPVHEAEQETAVQQRPQTTVVRQSSDRRSCPRAKSQLPVPSSRGQQTRASTAATSNNSSSSSSIPGRTQTPPSRSRTTNSSSSSRTKQVLPPSSSSNNNNFYRNINDNQSHEDIWILNRDLHENNNNSK